MALDSVSKLLKKKGFLISDGATGTELMRMGVLKKGISPEQLLLENPKAYVAIHRSYYDAGSDYVVAGTFGATKTKLAEWGLDGKIDAVNRAAIKCVRDAIKESGKKDLLCAASIGPTGRLLPPLGGATMDELVGIFSEQIKIILDEGTDLFVIETMSDIREAKAAYIAIRDLCKLPVGVCLTFDSNGRTLLNNTPQAFAVSFEPTDVSFIGVNCSVGPKSMLSILKDMAEYTSKPLIVNPNAGVGAEHFEIKEFTDSLNDWIACGARIFGGCCGTTPEYISALKKTLSKKKPVKKIEQIMGTHMSSGSIVVTVGKDYPCALIGQRINPTNRKKMSEELKNGIFDSVVESARTQIKDGANILDVNLGVAGVDQKALAKKVFSLLTASFETPLCIDSSEESVIETALRNYGGKLLINSTTADVKKSEKIFQLATKYGACVIGLAMDEEGIPSKAEGRLKLAERLLQTAKKNNLNPNDLIIDALTLSLSSNQDDALETIKTLKKVRKKLKLSTVLGLSNISYGLPERDNLNQTYLALALNAGLNLVIINPSSTKMMSSLLAMNVIKGHDRSALKYVKHFSDVQKTDKGQSLPVQTLDPISSIKYAVMEGNETLALESAKRAVAEGLEIADIVNNGVVLAIEAVGIDFKSGKCYLPQVVLSAQAVKKTFEFLKSKMASGTNKKGPLILMATVKGDIHDIGKNIVITLLETNGFEVHDLGKSVSAEDILKKAKAISPKAIGLSSLMTTTMDEMNVVTSELKKAGLNIPVVVGGAVVTKDFADSIGAIYAKDAVDGVEKFKGIQK